MIHKDRVELLAKDLADEAWRTFDGEIDCPTDLTAAISTAVNRAILEAYAKEEEEES